MVYMNRSYDRKRGRTAGQRPPSLVNLAPGLLVLLALLVVLVDPGRMGNASRRSAAADHQTAHSASRGEQGKQIRPDNSRSDSKHAHEKIPVFVPLWYFLPVTAKEGGSREALPRLRLRAICWWSVIGADGGGQGGMRSKSGEERDPLPPCYASGIRRKKAKRA